MENFKLEKLKDFGEITISPAESLYDDEDSNIEEEYEEFGEIVKVKELTNLSTLLEYWDENNEPCFFRYYTDKDVPYSKYKSCNKVLSDCVKRALSSLDYDEEYLEDYCGLTKAKGYYLDKYAITSYLMLYNFNTTHYRVDIYFCVEENTNMSFLISKKDFSEGKVSISSLPKENFVFEEGFYPSRLDGTKLLEKEEILTIYNTLYNTAKICTTRYPNVNFESLVIIPSTGYNTCGIGLHTLDNWLFTDEDPKLDENNNSFRYVVTLA